MHIFSKFNAFNTNRHKYDLFSYYNHYASLSASFQWLLQLCSPECDVFNCNSQCNCLSDSFHPLQCLLQLCSPERDQFNYHNQYASLSASFQLRSPECYVSNCNSQCNCRSFHFNSFSGCYSCLRLSVICLTIIISMPACLLHFSGCYSCIRLYVTCLTTIASVTARLFISPHSVVVTVVFAWV